MWSFVLIFFLIHPIYGVIYELNETEYNRMPPIIHIDDYKKCLDETNGVYCTVRFSAVSDTPSELLTMMQEYSKQYKTHFNHTNFQYGVCVTQKCRNYSEDKTESLREVLEVCLNETFWEEYKLKTQVTKYSCRGLEDRKIPLDLSDIIVAVVIVSLIILNIFGSRCYIFISTSNWGGKEYFLSFSVMHNWRRLTVGVEDRRSRLRGLHGVKSLIILCVIMTHSIWIYYTTPQNTLELEQIYYDYLAYILMNGSIVMQACFLMSGLLLMYQLREISESKKITNILFLKGVLSRWIRLIPSYAVVLGLMATWLRRIGSGPFWETVSLQAANDCRRNFWLHMLFLNNFVHNTQCMRHSWYIAADMQLYVLGLLVCVFIKTERSRRKVLMLLYVIGITIPPVITYFRDLDGLFIASPEAARVLYVEDPTFNEVYVRGYCSIAASALGLMLGDLVYSWQQAGTVKKHIRKLQKYRIIYWMLLPLCFAVIISGKYFYKDAPREPLYERVIFSMIAAPLFGLLIATLILGFIFKYEDEYRTFFEWRGWIVPSRLSYCAFLLHFPLIRVINSSKTSLSFVTRINMWITFIGIAIMSFALAIPLWLLVEAPFSQINKINLRAHLDTKNSEEHKKL